jgi:hypothetical protein
MTMADKEYIEREALAQLMEYAKCSHGNGDCEKCFGDWDCGGSCHDHAKTLIADIYNRTPAADVVEVRRGEWERIPYSFAGGYRCSCCGTKSMENYWNFCPNCGADMRGNNNDNRTEN